MSLARLIAEQQNFLCVTSTYQTQGKGTRYRKWESLKGNLHSTIGVNKKYWDTKFIGLLPLYTSIILHDKIRILLKNNTLDSSFLYCKWPNDLLFKNQKLSGILIESTPYHYLVGIGLNITQSPKIKNKQTISLEEIGIKHVCNQLFLHQFLTSFKKRLSLNTEQLIDWTLKEWSLIHNWNKTVYLRDDTSKTSYKPVAINKQGHLQIVNNQQKKHWLSSTYLE